MSQFREAVELELRCPKCGACNRVGVSYVHADLLHNMAECEVCAYDGKLSDFQPKGATT